MGKLWKKGRGKLGPFVPLHGSWVADAPSDMGPVRCRRVLEPFLGGHYLRLDVFSGSSAHRGRAGGMTSTR
jgi:hypothetical protein